MKFLTEDKNDLNLIDLLQVLQRQAEFKRRLMITFYTKPKTNNMALLALFDLRLLELKESTWRDHVDEPIFSELEEEARNKVLDWEIKKVELEPPIDLTMRGSLESLICGAIKDTINVHGPISYGSAKSAAKRVIGAIKDFNRKLKR